MNKRSLQETAHQELVKHPDTHFGKDLLELHEAIRLGSIEKVKEILESYPEEKYFVNSRKESAATVALQNQQLLVYALLTSSGVGFTPTEDVEMIMAPQSSLQKRLIRSLHNKHSVILLQNHLIELLKNSKVSHNNKESENHIYSVALQTAFVELNRMKWIRKLLELVSSIESLRIIFDFDRDVVSFLDPFSIGANGSSESYQIYVGAIGLLDERSNGKVIGTLIHELCHSAMLFVYENNAKPYHRDDIDKQREFEDIARTCETSNENLIKMVPGFYPVNLIHAELIVRVPQLLAIHRNDTEKLLETKNSNRELFEYYEQKVLIDLERKYCSAQVNKEVKRLNDLIPEISRIKRSSLSLKPKQLFSHESNEQICLVESNCPMLTMISFYDNVVDEIFDPTYIFANGSALEDENLIFMIKNALNMCTIRSPKLIVNCEDCQNDDVRKLFRNFQRLEMNRNIIVVVNDGAEIETLNLFNKSINIFHAWNDLTDNSKVLLLKSKVNFQGKSMTFKDLASGISLSDFKEIQYKKLINKNEVKIGNQIKIDDFNDYVNRSFIAKSDETQPIDIIELFSVSKCVVISDEPGVGKSTTLKILAVKLKQNNPSHWIENLKLGQNLTYSEADDEELVSKEKLVELITSKVFMINKFEEEIFRSLFIKDRVIILMDGFDEIPSVKQRIVIKLAKAIYNLSENKLIITTRPHLERRLMNNLKCKVIKFVPLSKADRSVFFDILKKNESQHDAFTQILNLVKRSEVMNPMLLKMIQEIVLISSNPLELNLYAIYDELLSKILNRSLLKGEENHSVLFKQMMSSFPIIDFYQNQAFHMFFNPSSIEKLRFKVKMETSAEAVLRSGLMWSYDSKTFFFIHKTFAEYFIASFFVKNINGFTMTERDEIKSSFAEVFSDDVKFKTIQTFIQSGDSEISKKNKTGKKRLRSAQEKIRVIQKPAFVLRAEKIRKRSLNQIRHFERARNKKRAS